MKRKYLVIIIVVVLFGAGVALYSKRQTLFPSQQMKALRQLEAHLNLPKPTYRGEEDLGYNKDSKGALHYSRHIALSYEDVAVLNSMRTKLGDDSWQEQPVNTIGSNEYFSFKKGTGKATQCVNGYTQPKDTDGIALYISLQASGEYSCNPASGV